MSDDLAKGGFGPLTIQTTLLIERLLTIEMSETITYSELSELIGCSVQQPLGRGHLGTARNRLMKDHDILFMVIRGIGLKRCAPLDKIAVVDHALRGHGRSVRRIENKSAAMPNEEYAALPPDSRDRVNTHRTVICVLRHFSKPKNVEKIHQLVAAEAKPIPLPRLLEDTVQHFSKTPKL